MENHDPNTGNSISSGTPNAASNTTPVNMPSGDSTPDSWVGNLQSQIQGVPVIHQQLQESSHEANAQSNWIIHVTENGTEAMPEDPIPFVSADVDMVDASTQTWIIHGTENGTEAMPGSPIAYVSADVDMVDASTQTMTPESEDEEEDGFDMLVPVGFDGQVLDFQNVSREDLLGILEHLKNSNDESRVAAFHLTVKCHKYNLSESTYLEANDNCSICLVDYFDGEDVGKLECGHMYHVECIKEWLDRRNRCPICQRVALPFLPA